MWEIIIEVTKPAHLIYGHTMVIKSNHEYKVLGKLEPYVKLNGKSAPMDPILAGIAHMTHGSCIHEYFW